MFAAARVAARNWEIANSGLAHAAALDLGMRTFWHRGSSSATERNKMKKTIMALWLVCALGFMTGCDREGPAERAGKEVDRDSERVRDRVDDSADKAGRDLERAGDKVQDAARDVKRDVQDATK
jgi:hypothetical protein